MIPFDLRGLFDAMGGNDAVVPRLDTYFTKLNAGPNSIYAFMGNEPCEGSPWTYDFAGAPWKTQEVVRRIQTEWFTPQPSGLPGNDDAGSISSWYVFSALGLYPDLPGVGGFVIGSPLFASITLNLPGGQTVQINAPNAADANPYVQRMEINGVPNTSLWLPVDTILNNPTTTLGFGLGSTPNTRWGSSPDDAPPSFDSVPDVPGTLGTLGVAGFPIPSSALDQEKRSNPSRGEQGSGTADATRIDLYSGLQQTNSKESERMTPRKVTSSGAVGLEDAIGFADHADSFIV